ncbi:hypothetical protein VNO78_29105 [Psophocarpus tetragonolobus]|uniref:AP2/ERF domain-containing protein n=1 Tax=Psophocarpus tetragonolobus TaxID=3891 RepID=A0AAN9RUW0_PSOTE
MASVVDSSSAYHNHSSFSSDDCKMYKGVRKRKWGKWVSEIRLPNSRERIWLGSYDTQEKAARAFDAALFCLRGRSASFNFPDTPQHLLDFTLVVPQTLSHQEIQEVAAKFANKETNNGNDNNNNTTSSSDSHELESSQTSDETKSNNNTRLMNNGVSVTHDDVQMDQQGNSDTTDWTFFNTLDDLNGSDYGLYFGPDKIMHPGEFLCPTQVPFFHQFDDQADDDDDHDAFSNHSFLWSWNF